MQTSSPIRYIRVTFRHRKVTLPKTSIIPSLIMLLDCASSATRRHRPRRRWRECPLYREK